MRKFTKLFAMLALTGVLFSSCKKDDDPIIPDDTNEEEVITTIKMIFTEQGTTNESTFVFKDEDGNGGEDPTIDTIRLSPSEVYDLEILLLNESVTPTDTISHEVEEEGDEHQFFYTATGASVTFAYSDADDNGVPIGLLSEWTTGTATTDKNGKVKVVLKHQPGVKPTTGTTGDPNAGDTDIEVDFPILIQ